jgi:hypothetical protein
VLRKYTSKEIMYFHIINKEVIVWSRLLDES